MKRNRLLFLCIMSALILSGCNKQEPDSNSGNTTTTAEAATGTSQSAMQTTTDATQSVTDTSDIFSNRDYKSDYTENGSILIELNGSTASSSSGKVSISGTTITLSEEGTYIISGTLDDGMIIVNASKDAKLQLILDGAEINSSTSAPIYVLQADKVFITLAENSENILSNGGEFIAIDENSIDAVIFSKEDLTLNGAGTLTVNSPAGHGIVSKDELKLTSGTYNINAASHGITGKDNICIDGATLNIISGKDGIHADNDDDTSLGFVYVNSGDINIQSEGDGISASAYIQLDGGSYDIVSGGGSANGAQHSSDNFGFGGGFGGGFSTTSDNDDSTSIKGIKASGIIIINAGSFLIDSADDAIHSNSNLTVCGGTYEIASGDDGFHADEALNIAGGSIVITESYEGLEGLTIDISGGDIDLTASDDGLNAAGGNDSSGFGGWSNDMFGSSDSYINISGGTLYVNAAGDGIDSNGTLTVTGGTTIISGPTNGGNGALDYGTSATITGGILVAAGASQMACNFTSAENQGSMMINPGSYQAGTTVTLTDSNGNTFFTWESDKSFSSIVISTPELVQNETYVISFNSTAYELTLSKLVYSAGISGSSGGGMGGHGGGGRR